MKSQTLTMLPAVEARTSDLLSDVAGQDGGTVSSNTAKDMWRPSLPGDGSSSSTTLPSLLVFDLPSFDLDSEVSSLLGFHDNIEATRPKVAQITAVDKDVDTTETTAVPMTTMTTTIAPAIPIDVNKRDGPARKKLLGGASRRHSWLVSSKSAMTIKMRKGGWTDTMTAISESGPSPASMDRPRTVDTLAGFARRSWKSRSPSPAPAPSGGSGQVAATTSSSGAYKLKAALAARKLTGGSVRSNRHSIVAHPNHDVRPARQEQEDTPGAEAASGTSRALSRASGYLTRIKHRPHTVFVSHHHHAAQAATAAKRPTADATSATIAAGHDLIAATSLPLHAHHIHTNNPRDSSHTTASSEASSTTGTAVSENASQSTAETSVTMPNPMFRDPLWANFRTLEADVAKFATKTTTAARMTLVRTALVPFLRQTDCHPSNHSKSMLSPDDVERRAAILNQWWLGLLEMLDGGNARHGLGILTTTGASASPAMPPLQPVAGVDRPTLLEVATMIMMRPEWRLCTPRHQPSADRHPSERGGATSRPPAATACDLDVWANSELLVESAEHNVRIMFQTNLLAQMAIVVDKMSQRHAPLSLVNWCGKACAYAFFFAPSIANMLVRLWVLPGHLLRSVADEYGLSRRSGGGGGGGGANEDMAALFPAHVAELVWTSVKALGDKLRMAAKLPLMAAKIPWYGPWVTRWRGGDTDLFFIFCKYYFILAQEFLPTGLSLVEMARAPAFVLVNAQMLAVLDTTIHRQASIDAALLGPPMSDALQGVDAALTPIMLPSNLLRDMNENRLVILLRDVLWEGNFLPPSVKHTFAQAFMTVMKAATKRTSRYEHGAHFVLCDFLEEALLVLDVYQNNAVVAPIRAPSPPSGRDTRHEDPSGPVDYVDWPFWFDVGKMILNSNNTLSEIRLLSFLFSVWDAVASDEERKKAVCMGWLLSEDVFERFFNNWCPLVRAYYMRLLCWRICRDVGRPSEVDTQIFLLVSHRLSTVWSHYLGSKQHAEENRRLAPSTAPCLPAPGRRFMIIKTEVRAPQPGFMLAFDQMASSYPSREAMLAYNSSIASTDEPISPAFPKPQHGASGYKRKWSLLGKVLSFTVTQANVGLGNVTAGTMGSHRRVRDDEHKSARRETIASRTSTRPMTPGHHAGSGPQTPTKNQPTYSPTGAPPPLSDSPSSTGSSPIYEAARVVFRFTLAGQPLHHNGMLVPRDRVLTPPSLPAPAQARVSLRQLTEAPLDTRRQRGSSAIDLVSEARNARPLLHGTPIPSATTYHGVTGGDMEKNTSLGYTVRAVVEDEHDDEDYHAMTDGDGSPGMEVDCTGGAQQDHTRCGHVASDVEPSQLSPLLPWQAQSQLEGQPLYCTRGGLPPPIQPVRPVGVYAAGAAYTGRALAEWALVVNECNNFVERRREEGVLTLQDMEVPSLGVEGMGMRVRA